MGEGGEACREHRYTASQSVILRHLPIRTLKNPLQNKECEHKKLRPALLKGIVNQNLDFEKTTLEM